MDGWKETAENRQQTKMIQAKKNPHWRVKKNTGFLQLSMSIITRICLPVSSMMFNI